MTASDDGAAAHAPLEIVPSFAVLRRNLGESLLINGAAPFIAYQILSTHGMPPVRALALTSVFPIAGLLVAFRRDRRADIIGVISLALIGLGIAGSFNFGPRFYLVRVSFGTSVFGLMCLGSLFYRRPLMFYLGRQVTAGNDPARVAHYERLWLSPRFRQVMRMVTTTWGVSYLLEAGVRVVVALSLPIATVLLVEPMIGAAVFVALLTWTIRYGRAAALQASASVDAARPGRFANQTQVDQLHANRPFRGGR